jgi:hypothetical protein
MRHTVFFRLLGLLTGLCLPLVLSAQTPTGSAAAPTAAKTATERPVVLYSAPNKESTVLGTVPLTDQLRKQSQVVAGTAETGAPWFSIEQSTPISGYVSNKDLGKDLSVKVGAPVRLTPAQESEILFHWEKGQTADFGDVSGSFLQVSTHRNVPAYYQLPAAPKPAPVAPQPKPVPTPVPAPAPVGPQPDGQPITPPITTYRLLREVPENPNELHYFEGTFNQISSIIRFNNRYSFELRGSDKSQIAYVDTSNVTSTEPLDRCFGRKVLIHGTVHRLSHSYDYVIVARSIRIRDN